MVVSSAEEWDDRSVFYSQENPTEHVGMEEVGDDDIRILATNELSETKNTRNIEYTGAGDSFDGDACRYEFRSEIARVFQSDDGMVEITEQGKCPKKHVFTPAVSE